MKILLAYGLDFCLPVNKLDFFKYFLSFEKLNSSLRDIKCNDYQEFKKQLQFFAYKYFYNFKPYKIFSAIFTRSDISLLKQLSKNKDLVISKPDKGRGVVIVNRKDYINSVSKIIHYCTKFQVITDSIQDFSLKVEDKHTEKWKFLTCKYIIKFLIWKQTQ